MSFLSGIFGSSTYRRRESDNHSVTYPTLDIHTIAESFDVQNKILQDFENQLVYNVLLEGQPLGKAYELIDNLYSGSYVNFYKHFQNTSNDAHYVKPLTIFRNNMGREVTYSVTTTNSEGEESSTSYRKYSFDIELNTDNPDTNYRFLSQIRTVLSPHRDRLINNMAIIAFKILSDDNTQQYSGVTLDNCIEYFETYDSQDLAILYIKEVVTIPNGDDSYDVFLQNFIPSYNSASGSSKYGTASNFLDLLTDIGQTYGLPTTTLTQSEYTTLLQDNLVLKSKFEGSDPYQEFILINPTNINVFTGICFGLYLYPDVESNITQFTYSDLDNNDNNVLVDSLYFSMTDYIDPNNNSAVDRICKEIYGVSRYDFLKDILEVDILNTARTTKYHSWVNIDYVKLLPGFILENINQEVLTQSNVVNSDVLEFTYSEPNAALDSGEYDGYDYNNPITYEYLTLTDKLISKYIYRYLTEFLDQTYGSQSIQFEGENVIDDTFRWDRIDTSISSYTNVPYSSENPVSSNVKNLFNDSTNLIIVERSGHEIFNILIKDLNGVIVRYKCTYTAQLEDLQTSSNNVDTKTYNGFIYIPLIPKLYRKIFLGNDSAKYLRVFLNTNIRYNRIDLVRRRKNGLHFSDILLFTAAILLTISLGLPAGGAVTSAAVIQAVFIQITVNTLIQGIASDDNVDSDLVNIIALIAVIYGYNNNINTAPILESTIEYNRQKQNYNFYNKQLELRDRYDIELLSYNNFVKELHKLTLELGDNYSTRYSNNIDFNSVIQRFIELNRKLPKTSIRDMFKIAYNKNTVVSTKKQLTAFKNNNFRNI